MEALFSGDIDIGYIGPVPAVSANVKSNGDVVILSGSSTGGAILVKRPDADIETVDGLPYKVHHNQARVAPRLLKAWLPRVLAPAPHQYRLAPMGSAGCGSKGEDQEVSVGYFNNVTHPQALYMKSQKTLEESLGTEKKVKWTAFNAGPAEVEALFSGDIDIGYIGPVPAVWLPRVLAPAPHQYRLAPSYLPRLHLPLR